MAVPFLWEEYAQSGQDFESLKADALDRVGRYPEWLFHLLEAKSRLQKRGLAPRPRRDLA